MIMYLYSFMENANVHKISRVSHKCCGWEDKNGFSVTSVLKQKERRNTNTKDGVGYI